MYWGRKRDSCFRKKTAFHEEDEQRQLLTGLHVPWDDLSPFPLSSPGPAQHGPICLVSTLIPLFCHPPLGWHLCWEGQESGGREGPGNGPERRQEVRGRRPRVRVPTEQAQRTVRKRVGPTRGGGVWAAGTAAVALPSPPPPRPSSRSRLCCAAAQPPGAGRRGPGGRSGAAALLGSAPGGGSRRVPGDKSGKRENLMALNRQKKKKKVSRKSGETREPSEPQRGCPGAARRERRQKRGALKQHG